MFHHTLHDLEKDVSFKISFNWFLLAFLSGNVNAGGFLACSRFVTHVTGFATLFGIDAAQGKWDGAIGISTVPIYFLIGVMISAYLVDRRIHHGRVPHYEVVMGMVAGCLILAAVGGYANLFGRFGEMVRLKQDYFFLVLLCMASGLQNAALTTSSGATVRTTHLTGITTDLGIGLVRAMFRKVSPERHRRDVLANWLRAGTIVAFMAGSYVGAALFMKAQYLGFLLPAGIALYAMRVAMKEYSAEVEAQIARKVPTIGA